LSAKGGFGRGSLQPAKEYVPLLLENLRLFPKIGEIPDWIEYAEFEYSYIKDNMEIQVTAHFSLKDNNWIIKEFQPDDYSLDEEEMKKKSTYISLPPPEGKRKLDVGLNDIIKKFLSDLKEENLASIKKYTLYHKYDYSDFKKKGRMFEELLSQFPSIGPIPVPAYKFKVFLKGKAKNEKVIMNVEFRWRDNELRIFDIDAYQRK